jgi:hypothetical protein
MKPSGRRALAGLGLAAALCASSASDAAHVAAPKSVTATEEIRAPRWLLGDFLRLVETDPARLMRLAEKLFSDERVRISTVEPSKAFDWQNRLAVVSALAHLFEPGTPRQAYRAKARAIVGKALASDPSLIVRDGAVESIRRMVRMDPREAAHWKTPLERAFLDARNHIEGEGLFIRETILTAMREASFDLPRRLRVAAERDRNPQVRDLLKRWNTAAYEHVR